MTTENKKSFKEGRLSIINELEEFIKKKQEFTKKKSNNNDLLKKCTASGVLSAYSDIVQEIKVKKQKTLNYVA